jgi:hypothetical protein
VTVASKPGNDRQALRSTEAGAFALSALHSENRTPALAAPAFRIDAVRGNE